MNYEEAARKLIVYSGGLAKGSLSTARAASVGEGPVLQYLVDNKGPMNPSVLADTLGYTRPRMTRILDSLVSKAVASQLSAMGDQNVIELLNVLEKAYSITYDREPEINRSDKKKRRHQRKNSGE